MNIMPIISTDGGKLMRTSVVLAALFAACIAPAWAQVPYPAKPVRIVVPFPPGGPTDVLARVLAQKLGDSMGQQFVVDNRPGATGTIAAAMVAKSPPDGYTMIMHSTSSHVSAYLYRQITYDPMKDFAPVASAGALAFYLVTHPSLPVKTVKEIIALAKRSPGELAFCSAGSGSGGHLVMAMFMAETGIKLLHVPYKGAAPMIADLIAGQTSLGFDSISTSQPHVKAGRLRAIAVSSAKRMPAVPEIPTVMESGVPGFENYLWFGLLAPAGTPSMVISRLSGEINKVLGSPDYQQRMLTLGGLAAPNSPEQFADFLKTDTPKWIKVINDTGARVD
jgi:tripartite-type tricarboxylate transporter receptor subunit TctC